MTNKEYEPFKITGIVTESVTQPKNDGSRGSGLYAIPFSLSRSLNPFEQGALVQAWDNPSSFSTMHRPGIASCNAYRFVLNGTTVEEVRDHHMGTLKGAVEMANAIAKEQHDRIAASIADAQTNDQLHKRNINDVAGGLKF
ncbi:hypothetical protein SAMN04489740_0878 [Arthrobacter alpinus]|uniref:Uncharacterized protein n=1 Tax=Arthrobacter alpinus TaxID=656366 RepID=A0A1H5GXR7_9MICC|nr:hypothetical protein [Arthrobacter alpinus]SEE20533.1 hypothetical protein SAMN04489740_0878 [Arthrobacter alpinus]